MKLKNINLKTKGFTIIEVVLVLAIAGLIIAAVFIAVPGLQAGQRDTARKNDVSAVLGAVSTRLSNVSTLPDTGDWSNSGAKLSANTTTITVVSAATGAQTLTDAYVYVMLASKCDTQGVGTVKNQTGTKNQVAVYTKLEGSGGIGYCVNN